MNDEALGHALETFAQTIHLKLQQFHSVVGKGANNDLAGIFIEELVRGFIRGWLSPCRLLSGTLHPFNYNPEFESDPWVPQIDGIVFDPRQGLAVMTEGEFLVAHPSICPGVIEIKKSENNLREFEDRLAKIHKRFYCRHTMTLKTPCCIMGVVIHDPDPQAHSCPDWLEKPLYDGECNLHCPIFILFQEVKPGVEYNPYEPGIKAMIKSIFNRGWALDLWWTPLSRPKKRLSSVVPFCDPLCSRHGLSLLELGARCRGGCAVSWFRHAPVRHPRTPAALARSWVGSAGPRVLQGSGGPL